MRAATELARLIVSIAVMALICSLARAGSYEYQHGTLIDTGEYDRCHYDCAPFDRPNLYFCVQVQGQILIGSHKADWIWAYDSSKMFALKDKTVSVRFDHDSIWIVRTDGKDMRLTQDYSQDIFTRPECTAEIHRHWLRQYRMVKRPSTVSPDAVLIPQGPRRWFGREGPHFWVQCSFHLQEDWDVCDLWDEKGARYQEVKCVGPSGTPVPAARLIIDPLTTKFDYEIHLKNGFVLKLLR